MLRSLAIISCFTTLAASPALAEIAFDEVTDAAGVGGNATETFGASWGDFNRDGYPDLFTDNHRDFGRLWKNNRNGTFTDITVTADVSKAFGPGAQPNKDTHGASWADFDNDGDQDLATTWSTKSGHYLVSDGIARLTDRRTQLGLTLQHDNGSRLPVFFDVNNDGRLDLKVTGRREIASNFFRQNANGNFTRVADSLGIVCPENNQWGQLLDVDAKGKLEFLCGENDFPQRVLDYATKRGVAMAFPVTSLVADAISGDFNNDARQDLFYVRGPQHPNEALQAGPRTVEAHIVQLTAQESHTITIGTAGSLSTDLGVGQLEFHGPGWYRERCLRWGGRPPSPGAGFHTRADGCQSRHAGTGGPQWHVPGLCERCLDHQPAVAR